MDLFKQKSIFTAAYNGYVRRTLIQGNYPKSHIWPKQMNRWISVTKSVIWVIMYSIFILDSHFEMMQYISYEALISNCLIHSPIYLSNQSSWMRDQPFSNFTDELQTYGVSSINCMASIYVVSCSVFRLFHALDMPEWALSSLPPLFHVCQTNMSLYR